MSIDHFIQNASYNVFSNLEEGELRILGIIAKEGPLNMKELGLRTSKYSMGFDRKGVRKRLFGTQRFLGLVSSDYLIPIPVNKKETKYSLTLKGLLASLAKVNFERNYLIRLYRTYFTNYGMKDQYLAKWGIQLMKTETALLLYYVMAQGLDWTKFKQTRLYFHDLWKSSQHLLRTFYMNMNLLTQEQKEEFTTIKNEYLKSVIAVHLITELDDRTISFPIGSSENSKDLDELEKRKLETLGDIRDWYFRIYLVHYHYRPYPPFLEELQFIDEMPPHAYDENVIFDYDYNPVIEEVANMLTKHGYNIKERDRSFG